MRNCIFWYTYTAINGECETTTNIMMNEKIIAIIIAFIILATGIIAAFITPKNINLRKFHTSISLIFILIIILGIPVHFQRLIDKSSYNFITWLHFLIFSYLLYISINLLN